MATAEATNGLPKIEIYSTLTRAKTPLVTVKPGHVCLLYTSPSPRDGLLSRMPSSA